MHIRFCRHIWAGGTFSPLLDISERNIFPRWGSARAPSAPPLRTRLGGGGGGKQENLNTKVL